MAKVLNDLVLRISADTAKLQKGVNETNKKLGDFQAGLNKVGKLVAGAFAVTAIIDFAKGIGLATLELGKISKSIERFADLTKDALIKSTTQVKSLSDTFEVSSDDIIRSAKAMSNELGIGFTKALDLIEEGFVKGSDANGEFLDGVREYSTFIKDAGFSAEQFVSILKSQSDLGIFSDKGIDTIKEGTIRLREMTSATKDAIEGLGINSAELQAGIENGTISMEEALQQVSKKIVALEPTSQQVGTALADIFGGAGEDAGLRWQEAIATGFKNITITAKTEAEEQKQAYLDSIKFVTGAWAGFGIAASSTWEVIKTLGNNVIGVFLTGINGIANQFVEYFNLVKRAAEEALSIALQLAGLAPGNNAGTPTDPNAFPLTGAAATFQQSGSDEENIPGADPKTPVNINKTVVALTKEEQAAKDLATALAAAAIAQQDLTDRVGISTQGTRTDRIPELGNLSPEGATSGGLDLKSMFEGLGNFIAAETLKGELALESLKLKAEEAAAANNEILLESFSNIGQVIVNLANTLANIDWSKDAAGGIAAIAGSIAQLLPQVGQAIAALMALAGAEAAVSGAKLPPPLNIIAIAAGVAAAIAGFASLSSIFSKKAVGGLVGGSPGFTMVGEQGPELLQIGQPGRVYSAGQTNNLLGGNGGGDVSFRIEGDALVGVLSKTNTKNNIFG